MVQFHVKAPEFVMRQWYKHVVGIETTSTSSSTKDHAWNEISGRYVPVTDFIIPQNGKQSEDNKQASEGAVSDQEAAKKIFDSAMNHVLDSYQKLLDAGVAKEQAE